MLVGDAAKDARNGFAARVTQVTFLGDLIRVTLQPTASSGPVVNADLLRASLPVIPRVGDTVEAAFPSRHLLLLGGDV